MQSFLNALRAPVAAVVLAVVVLGVAPAAQAVTQSCSTTKNGKTEATFTLGNATDATCFSEMNDTNSVDSSFAMFGLTGWTLADKNDDASSGTQAIAFTNAPGNGGKFGTWAIDTLAGSKNVVITLKAGKGFGAFLLDLTVANPLAGFWESTKGLSHASIYYQSAPPNTPSINSIPLPAGGLLLLTGLAGLGFAARRKRG